METTQHFQLESGMQARMHNVGGGMVANAVPPHPGPLPKGEGDPFAGARSHRGLRFHKSPPAMFPSPQGRGIKGEGKGRPRMAQAFNFNQATCLTN